MIYFSEIKGKKVLTEDRIEVGILDDLIFIASEEPLITKLLIKDKLKNSLIIPISNLLKFDTQIIISKDYIIDSLAENELYILRNLADKQIIDLIGNKIVRVNDITLQEKMEEGGIKGKLYVAGVDVGFLGVMRWLHLESVLSKFLILFNIKLTSKFLSWGDIQPLELVHGAVKLKKTEEKLEKIRPEDLADYLEKTNVTNARRFLKILGEKKAVDVIGSLDLNYQVDLFKHYKTEKSAHLLSMIDPDEAVDILLSLSHKKRDEIVHLFSEKKQKEIKHLLSFSTTMIGNLLTTVFLTVNANSTVQEVLKKVKNETADFSFLTPIYVVNDFNQLIGVFNLHELVIHNAETPVYKFMIQNVVSVRLTTPIEIAIKKTMKYRLAAIPVIDNNKHILGLVTIIELALHLFKDLK